MARGVPHSEETKAAVLAALLAGQGLDAVAASFHIGKSTISAWRTAAGLDGSEPVRTQKGAELGELVADYLRESLVTLKAQAEHFRDKAWLNKQSAADLAVLHGVAADKALRILSALEPTDGETD